MSTFLIIVVLTAFLFYGFLTIFKESKRIIDKLNFAVEYRNKFVEFANIYFSKYDRFERKGEVDNQLYVWLTKNVNKIQSQVGQNGTIHYVAPFRQYQISNYQVIINSIPKFRDGNVQEFDVNSVDDCLLRYIGQLEEYEKTINAELKNPFIWFRQGVQEALILPLLIFKWFGIFSSNFFYKIKQSLLYKIFSGIMALVTLFSGIVTIIVGWDQTIIWIKHFIN